MSRRNLKLEVSRRNSSSEITQGEVAALTYLFINHKIKYDYGWVGKYIYEEFNDYTYVIKISVEFNFK